VDALQEVGGAVKFAFNNSTGSEVKVIVVRSGEETYHAFSDQCTHGGNELNYVYEEGKLQCSSLGHSQFDLAGNVLKGPARGVLARYPLRREGDDLMIEV
jgi:nitrite reductase/ring-hydroxylating ferredoxin subunit